MGTGRPQFLDALERWKPATEFLTGLGGLIISMVALTLSVYAVYVATSAPDISVYPGKHFGLAVLRGNHLSDWDLPDRNHPETTRFLVLDFAVVLSNAGGKRGVIDHVRLDVTRLSDGETVELDWKLFFDEPSSSEEVKRTELVTPIVLEGRTSQRKMIRFVSDTDTSFPEGFFYLGKEYRFAIGVHEGGSDGAEVIEVYAVTWSCDEDGAHNIGRNDYGPRENPTSGATALLTLY